MLYNKVLRHLERPYKQQMLNLNNKVLISGLKEPQNIKHFLFISLKLNSRKSVPIFDQVS